ncbi:MAG: hypothetical protein ACOX5T_04525 [Candidatus Cryptobacteroides sp.]|jgi:hypothetical protein
MRNILFTIFLSVLGMMLNVSSHAQGPGRGQGNWMDRVKAEKIAFLTNAMELSPAEAEKFWPIYNQAETEKRKSMDAVMQAYRSLDKAVREKKDDKEITTLLDRYLTALQSDKDIDQKYAAEYRKILPGMKVAKLYIGEESFRRKQIHRLRRN